MEFIKILWDNLLKGPVTEPFPHGEAHTPARFRGKVKVDPTLCVGCGICRHVCTAGAINITARPDNSGYDIVVWHNSCCLCGQCRHYCPTKAVTLSGDWHNAHRNSEKFTWVEHQFVEYETCEQCGALQRFLPPSVTERLYAGMIELENLPKFDRLCVKCRMAAVAVAEERACRIDHIDQLVGTEQACLLPGSEDAHTQKTEQENAKPAVVKPDVVKAEIAKPETAKAETAKPDVVKAETAKAETAKPESTSALAEQPAAVQEAEVSTTELRELREPTEQGEPTEQREQATPAAPKEQPKSQHDRHARRTRKDGGKSR